jgi:hypothetical protein
MVYAWFKHRKSNSLGFSIEPILFLFDYLCYDFQNNDFGECENWPVLLRLNLISNCIAERELTHAALVKFDIRFQY